jgi:bacteriorhodopsin
MTSNLEWTDIEQRVKHVKTGKIEGQSYISAKHDVINNRFVCY